MKLSVVVWALVFLASPLAAQSAPTWRLVPEAIFGASGDPGSEFSDIRGVEVSNNGNVLVLDYKAHNIRVFTPDGKFLRVIGRGGEGPGEFGEPNGFARSPDGSIWVNDPANHRYSVRADDGAYIKDVPSAMTSFGWIWDAWFDGTSRMVSRILVHVPGATGEAAYKGMLERREMTSNRADTLPEPTCGPPPAKVRGWSGRSSHGGITMGIPYIASRSLAYSPSGLAWCAFGGEYTIYRLGIIHGDTQQVIRGRAAPIPVTAAERDSAVTAAKALFAKSGTDASEISAADIPRTKPVVIGLALDDQNRLWVRLTPAVKGHTRYDVYDAKGVAIGAIDLPASINQGPNVLIRGDKLYGVVLDADDVPTVIRYRIEKAR